MGVITRGTAVIQYALLSPDGSVIEEWRNLGHTHRDSAVTMTEEDPEEDDLFANETDTPLDSEITGGAKRLEYSLVNPSLEQLAKLHGGTVTGTGAAAVLSYPLTKYTLDCAIRVLPKKGYIYRANKTATVGVKNADYAKGGIVLHKVTSKVMQPTNAAVQGEQEGPTVDTIRGGIATATVIKGTTSVATGSVTGVKVIDIAGSGAVATVVVADGAVTTVTITSPGRNYHTNSIVELDGYPGVEVKVATVA